MAMERESFLGQLDLISSQLKEKLAEVHSESELEKLRQEYFGKKGFLSSLLKKLGEFPSEERSELGKKANFVKEELMATFQVRERQLRYLRYERLAEEEWFDVTEPPLPFPEGYHKKGEGHIHPVSQVQKELEDIFTSMGFSILDGPQVETDFYNFGALNFTEDHPAREMQDTFYTNDGFLLRTHTSPVQVRAMQQLSPPFRIIVPGRVFRYEELDASHEHTFYQMEGMVIDREVSVGHLLFLMHTLLKEIFKQEVNIRLRPGYFPFVEPGFELDMLCLLCGGKGCSVCKQTGYVEVLPCGLVHPNVLRAGGLDPMKWQGAAFGLGLTRLVMLRYKIEDIRHFMSADPAFLRQF
ncbi:MAG: phenylalanine--tRNA ligase subunit alpha [Leptospiraceae bacterium]|nr:phenylalanine--tRNA ligase subunit alpha [Leptospiraceae bacterium]MDW8306751.1 phenylalanine--tRNA ligase subunit alpha [Leptospiraceae bacterium]